MRRGGGGGLHSGDGGTPRQDAAGWGHAPPHPRPLAGVFAPPGRAAFHQGTEEKVVKAGFPLVALSRASSRLTPFTGSLYCLLLLPAPRRPFGQTGERGYLVGKTALVASSPRVPTPAAALVIVPVVVAEPLTFKP